MEKKFNGYIKWIGTALAIAAIIWNAATLHNDVKHLKEDVKDIKTYLINLERGKK